MATLTGPLRPCGGPGNCVFALLRSYSGHCIRQQVLGYDLAWESLAQRARFLHLGKTKLSQNLSRAGIVGDCVCTCRSEAARRPPWCPRLRWAPRARAYSALTVRAPAPLPGLHRLQRRHSSSRGSSPTSRHPLRGRWRSQGTPARTPRSQCTPPGESRAGPAPRRYSPPDTHPPILYPARRYTARQ